MNPTSKLITSVLLTLAIASICTPINSQILRDWVRYQDTTNLINKSERAVSLCLDDSLNVYVAGESYNNRYKVTKYSEEGNLVWFTIYDSYLGSPKKILPNGYGKFFLAGTNGLMLIDHNGGMNYLRNGSFIDIKSDQSGYFYSAYGLDSSPVYLLKYAHDGFTLWNTSYSWGNHNHNPVFMFFKASGLISVYSRYYYITGGYLNTGNVLLTFDTSGTLNSAGALPAGSGFSVVDNYSNSTFYTGSWSVSNWHSQLVFYKQNALGVMIDTAVYFGPGNGKNEARSIATDNMGGIYVASRSWGVAVDYDFVVLKYSTNAELLWEYRYNGSQNSIDGAEKVAVDVDGNIIVTGTTTRNAQGVQIFTVKLSPQGQLLWHDFLSRYNSATDSNIVTDLQADGHGGIYICGASRSNLTGVYDFMTIKYSDRTLNVSSLSENALECQLFQNFPNPFNPSTYIRFNLKNSDIVRVRVFNCEGRMIDDLANSRFTPGDHVIEWNAEKFSSGVYFISLVASNYSEIKKALLVK